MITLKTTSAAISPPWSGTTDGVAKVADLGVHPGEDSSFNRSWGGPLAQVLALTVQSSLQIAAGPAVFTGIECSSGASITLSVYNATSSTGTPFFSRVMTTNTGQAPLAPIYCANGIWVTPSSTAATFSILGIPST